MTKRTISQRNLTCACSMPRRSFSSFSMANLGLSFFLPFRLLTLLIIIFLSCPRFFTILRFSTLFSRHTNPLDIAHERPDMYPQLSLVTWADPSSSELKPLLPRLAFPEAMLPLGELQVGFSLHFLFFFLFLLLFIIIIIIYLFILFYV